MSAGQTDWSGLSQQLYDGARSLQVSIDEQQADRLLRYVRSLESWNAVHSLSAWKSPSDLLVHHVLDSMTVIKPLTRFAGDRALRILDAGSGPGFPAAVLAAMRPQWAVTALDAVAKKVAFVRQAATESGLVNLTAIHARLEDHRPSALFDVVISRAFASLERFVAVTDHLLAAHGVWLAQKGKVPDREMARLHKGVQVFHVEPVTVPGLVAERTLVWMRRGGNDR